MAVGGWVVVVRAIVDTRQIVFTTLTRRQAIYKWAHTHTYTYVPLLVTHTTSSQTTRHNTQHC